ncbi:putative stage V sporulation protein D [Clostridiales bacterium oral taxon 876 str. F0540]|nr:putative stage V sporulation protein D [Clostridiales bacterium oral taxon 876 str. F0540]
MRKLKKEKRNKGRFKFIWAVILILFVALEGRLIYVMSVKGAVYKQLATDQWTKTIDIAPKRGVIQDRNGFVLATSVDVYRVDADLKVLKTYLSKKNIPEDLAVSNLSKALDIDISKMQKIFDSKDDKGEPLQFVSLKRQVEKKSADAVRNLKYSGLMLSQDETRMYPNGSFLSHVIGHTDGSGKGINGVEQFYNKELDGESGSKILEADRTDNELPDTEFITKQPVNGNDLTLTIDTKIQMLAERVANETLKENSAKSVSITIMDPTNGEILGMVNTPSYDLNNPNKAGKTSEQIQEAWKNGAVSDVFEPGSIFKVMTAAAGLQTGSVTEKDRFNSTGSIKVANRTLYNDQQEVNGILDLAGILRFSDNVGFIQLGQKIGKEKLYSFASNAGFGQKTGVDLPGESTGIMKQLKDIGPVELATMSYGQGIALTQVQYLAAFNAVANGGTWIRPHVMKEISHQVDDKKVVDSKYDNLGEKSIMDSDKAAQLRTYLEEVVNKGTATATFMEGYHIAGKTGTANKVNPETGRYEEGKYIASFAGMAPANNPKVTLIVTVKEPSPDKFYAAQTAVPAAQKLFTELFTIMNISPDNQKKK